MSDIDYRIEPKFRNKAEDITKGSVWQLLSSTKLLVVTDIEDGWASFCYVDGNNGMKREASMDFEQFLSFYHLFYKSEELL